jgi:hypothetical protein
VSSSAATAGLYRRPQWQEALARSLPERWIGYRAHRWVGRLPLVSALVVLAALALHLRNAAHTDEALYINAGHDYIGNWLTGDGVGSYGNSFPGVPFLYPVLAAALDSVGGLGLVRGFSLGCVMVATLFLAGAVAAHMSRRAGYLAATMFVTTGPVAFVAEFGTFDAGVLALLAAALWSGTARTGTGSALATGMTLGLVPVIAYAATVFVPVTLAATLLMATGDHRRRRALIATTLAVAVPAVAWLAWGDSIRGGVVSQIWGQRVLSPYSLSGLAGWFVLDVGVLLLTALAGVLVLLRTGRKGAVLAVVLMCGGLVLPLEQMWLGESVSFDKHLAYSAVFLAPLAGIALGAWSRRMWKFAPVLLVVAVALLFGFTRSSAMYAAWANVDAVVEAIEADPRPGLYFAGGTASEPLRYYTRHVPDVQWENAYALYAKGDDAVRVAIEDLHFQTVILHSASTGSAVEDARQAVMLRALHDNYVDYKLVASIPVDARKTANTWLVYQQVEEAP